MKVNKADYVARIANATPLKLTIITYELTLAYIAEAADSETEKEVGSAVTKARAFLADLRNSLDMSYEISGSLMPLYIYVDKLLAANLYSKNIDTLNECTKILTSLLGSWNKLDEQLGDEAPIVENSQQLYAGLTYGRNGQLEEYMPDSHNRGFKA